MMLRCTLAVLALLIPGSVAAQLAGHVQATLPTEALAPVLGAPGEVWVKGMRLRAPLIAEQGLRAAGGIVRDGSTAVLSLVLIGRVATTRSLPTDNAARAWCDLTAPMLGQAATFPCFQDLDGDGALDSERRALPVNPGEPLTIAWIDASRPLAPVRYRIATTAELPTYRLVYESCGGADPIRFVQRVRGGGGGPLSYACTARAEPVAGAPGQLRIDRLTVRIDPKVNSAAATLIDGIPAGTLLDRIMPGEAVVDLGSRLPILEEVAAVMAKFVRPAFFFVDAPRVATQARGPTDVLIEGRLGFAYTGRVRKQVTISNLTSTRTVEAGEAVYGVPMGGGGGLVRPSLANSATITWCAPRRTAGGWRAACIPVQAGATHTIIENVYPAFMVRSVGYRADTMVARGVPEVDEQPVDFGTTVTIRYRVEKWSKKEARLTAEIDAGDGKPAEIRSWVQATPGNVAEFDLGGGRFRLLRTDGDFYRVEVVKAPVAGGNAVPTGDIRHLFL